MSTGSGEFAEQWTTVSPQGSNSAYSSPSQLVPHFECSLDSLLSQEDIRDENKPFLKITEQPQGYYKFRYRSEMQNSHGCLHGRSYVKNSNERYFPGVELFNYYGRAIIKCKLAQVNNEHEHPHRLCVNDINDVSFQVPRENSYKAWFSDLCIVHTPAREVTDWLYRGHETETLCPEEQAIVRRQCEGMAKLIQLNIVRLKFSAHHPDSDEEICAPVFSDPIRNLKSAATNILKICRLSRIHGRVSGHDDVIMLVERVIKKNIMIRFFELNEDGKETWSDTGRFLESDVHHQYAIVFTTPPYENLNITTKRQVFVELVRPSDGKKSDPVEFYYTPEPILQNKKRKLNHFFENQQTVPVISNSLDNYVLVNQIETPQATTSNETQSNQLICPEGKSPLLAQSSIISQRSNENGVFTFKIPVTPAQMNTASVDDNILSSENTTMDASSMDASIASAVNMVNDMEEFQNSDMTEYFDALLAEFSESVPDSGRGKTRLEAAEKEETYDDQTIIKMMAKKLQQIVEMIRIKRESFAKRLQALFDLRLSNGDTFLHLTLDSKQPLLDYLINLIHDSNMSHLLNLKNLSAQTILHQAVAKNLCDMIPFLVSKGCDPMLEDVEGNNAIHFSVKNEDSLEPLLNATEKYNVPRSLDACNYEKQTPLHLAVIYKSVSSVQLLLARGASCGARDGAGRAPLHLTALDDYVPIARLLLEHQPSLVNDVDGRGYTALQIVCDKPVTNSSIEMVKLLLEYKADPMQHMDNNSSAWQLAKLKPAIRDLLQEHVPADQADGDSEDEFQSADEGDSADQDEDVSEITYPLKCLKLAS
ncbi:hypothetical protein ABMA28_000845 [Loxostege sticticalis]|uniref:RHD domain-containing protein n=1 Tax=Loxostege sticticalis TaxID=481309 RepID=A0ABD0T3R3_LOXSC